MKNGGSTVDKATDYLQIESYSNSEDKNAVLFNFCEKKFVETDGPDHPDIPAGKCTGESYAFVYDKTTSTC